MRYQRFETFAMVKFFLGQNLRFRGVSGARDDACGSDISIT
jgi:hypothetical protein